MSTAITWLVLTLALGLPFLTVWYAVAALLVRPFGIKVPLLVWSKDYKKAVQTLTRVQYSVFGGVICFGAGSQLFIALARYVEFCFKLDHGSPETLGEFLGSMIWFMLWGGISWGWLMWKHPDPFSGHDGLSINPKPRS
jgi:hypothetical protein